ncbi:MAG TPA: efflux RND transporter periplasmic adaptor subunit [Candidatus Acidoferrales bacterium]|nr:efflux RND transporter periplasmic adaptor subunit [Candidatus Acidoferrales bacterium]
MKRWKKIAIGVAAAGVLAGIVVWSINYTNKGVVTIQTGRVARQDLTSVVTASGEIKPKTYTNVLGEGFGKITEIVVKEGDVVKRGDVLLRLENIQPTADVEAQRAGVSSAEEGVNSAEANFRAAQADLVQRQADLERAKFDWDRAQSLYKEGLIPKADYDARKSAYDGASAAVDSIKARLQQLRAELERSRAIFDQNRAMLNRTRDVLRKTTYTAPIGGVVTYIAVRVGENVVPGIQNSPGSYLMTISDMSVVTAEVKVDETDIVNVKGGQASDVTIDAMPGKTFTGHVTEVGTQAVLRTSGLATTQTTASTQEAKDFKVVVTLDSPPAGLRPGLSTTAKIRTAERKNALAIPIQALAVRSRKELEEAAKEAGGKGGEGVTLAATKPAVGTDPKKEEIQGVFVVRGKKAEFVKVETGITGVSDIEVLNGVKENDEIVIGSYKALRTLRPGAAVKVDNKAPKKEEEKT